jgi:hypothetical protein
MSWHRFFQRYKRLGIFLTIAFVLSLSPSGDAKASGDGWRSWSDMESGRFAVVYGAQTKIYDCFNRKGLKVALQVRGRTGKWEAMQTVTTKKSFRCKSGYFVALFNGKVTELGTQLDDGLYIEMRILIAKTQNQRAYQSNPILVSQFKSKSDQMNQYFEVIKERYGL